MPWWSVYRPCRTRQHSLSCFFIPVRRLSLGPKLHSTLALVVLAGSDPRSFRWAISLGYSLSCHTTGGQSSRIFGFTGVQGHTGPFGSPPFFLKGVDC